MSVAVRIDDELYKQAEQTAKAECRTVPLQVSYWAKIGKAALDNPDLPVEFIRDILFAADLPPTNPSSCLLPFH